MVDLNADYEVMAYSVGDTKAGTKMGKLQLRNINENSTLNCILWEETLNRLDPKLFRTGNIVKITGASFNEKFNNCLVSNMELIKEAALGLSEETREELYSNILKIIDEFKNDKLKEFVKDIWVKNKDLIKISPAAKMMHHNYLGGLIQHIYECLEFAQCIYPNMYKKINKDILFAACILHDIGKIFEYKINFETGFVDYNEDFRKDWISHSQYGFTLCMSNDQPQIAKMIASHHGRADWGAMIDLGEKDLENYYYIVHHIDDLSAKFGRIYVSDL
jgi:3'-5' exoribonuclease